MGHWVIVIGLVVGCAVLLGRKPRSARAARPTDTPTPAAPRPLSLSCPNCGYSVTLEDLTLIGESVACPICDEIFVVLSPTGADRTLWESSARSPVGAGQEGSV